MKTAKATITIDEKTLLRLGAYAQQRRLETLSEAISSLLDSIEPKSPSLSQKVMHVLGNRHNPQQESPVPSPAKSPPVYYGNSLEIVYFPSGEENFKRELLTYKKAHIRMFYKDGKIVKAEWVAQKFSESSNVRGNLKTGYLRGWRDRGIYKAEISIEPFAD